MFRNMLTIPDISENGYVASFHDSDLIRWDVDESHTLSERSCAVSSRWRMYPPNQG